MNISSFHKIVRIFKLAFLIITIITSWHLIFQTDSSPVTSHASIENSDVNGETNLTNEYELLSRNPDNDTKTDALILLSTDSSESMRDSIKFIRERGGKVVHIFPTRVLFTRINQTLYDILVERPEVEQITYSKIDPSTIVNYDESVKIGVEAWNNNYAEAESTRSLELPPDFEDPGPIINDTVVKPDMPEDDALATPRAIPYGAGFYDTSEYMIGDISVAIIFPESNGAIDPNQENWVVNDINAIVGEIQSGLNWWNNREPDVDLSFTYTISISETSYEPIHRSSSDRYLWISEIMTNKGYTTGSHISQTYSYLNDEDVRFLSPNL
ncbi:hypothetical protein ACFLQ6_07665 [Thermoproteota archaeon]